MKHSYKEMSDSAPINVKMKLADPDEVDRRITAALHESGWLLDQPDAVVADLVRSVHVALVQGGCVIIQVDNENRTVVRQDTGGIAAKGG